MPSKEFAPSLPTERLKIVIIGLAFFLIFSGMTILLSYRHYQETKVLSIKEDRTTANLISLVSEQTISKIVKTMESYSSRPLLIRAVKERNPEKAKIHLASIVKSNPDTDILVITDKEGTLWAVYPERPESMGLNLAHREWYKGVSKNWKSYVSDVVIRAVADRNIGFQIAAPVTDESGSVVGILVTSQRTTEFAKILQGLNLDPGTFANITDRTGNLVYSTRFAYDKQITPYPFYFVKERAIAAKNPTVPLKDPYLEGRTRYLTYAPVDDLGWSVFVGRDSRTILMSGVAYYIQTAATALLLFIVSTGSLFYLRKRALAQQLREQLEAEITLRQSEESERETRDYLDKLIGYANAPIIVWDTQFIITRFNHAFEDLTGLKAEEVLGKEIDLLFPEGRREECLGHFRQTTGGERWEVMEIPILRRDGSVRTVLWNSATIYGPDGKTAIATIAQGQDITDRKRLQEETERHARQLTMLHETSVELTAELNLNVLLQSIAEHSLNLIGGAACNCYLYNPQADLMERVATAGTALIPSPITRRQGEGMVGQVWENGTPLLVNDYRSWPGRTQAYDSFASRALVAVPFRSGTEILGVLNIMAPLPHQYTPMDVEMLSLFAAQAAIAIRNARLHDRMKMELAERERAEEEIKKLNAELEQRVVDRTAQLSASNKELEAFSYSVSHDLRAPLRSIDGFSQALLEEYQDKPLDATGKTFLERVRKATQRMGLLIDDMLKLSRITQAEMKREPVDLSGMIHEITEAQRKSNPDRAVDVTVQQGIMVHGDPYLLKIAMENLVGNAFKFTGKEEHPRIEFGMTVADKETACFIRDNGAGFDMAYVNKLFGAFQRLHTTDEFPGTGIGLATVQRIIHRHGGRVWAEGEKGNGATLYFTLPS